jgi:hypothetical protein
VYQALSTHDRFKPFTPVFARRKNGFKNEYKGRACEYVTTEVWFPGQHPDIGRQRLIFPGRFDVLTKILYSVNLRTNFLIVEPNYQYSLNVLEWMRSNMIQTESSIWNDDFFHQYYSVAVQQTKPSFFRNAISWIFPVSPVSRNLYDVLFNYVKPFVGSGITDIFLADRQIPPMNDATFYKEQDNINEFMKGKESYGNLSNSYNAFVIDHVTSRKSKDRKHTETA